MDDDENFIEKTITSLALFSLGIVSMNMTEGKLGIGWTILGLLIIWY